MQMSVIFEKSKEVWQNGMNGYESRKMKLERKFILTLHYLLHEIRFI